jgi:hypothetical protein
MLIIYRREPAAGAGAITEAVTGLLRRRNERGLGEPWSIAELGLDTDDYSKLSAWATGLDDQTVRRWLVDSWTFMSFPGGISGSPRACIGLLLLALAAEVARRQAAEGTLWPHGRRDADGTRRLRNDVDQELFDFSSQPTDAFKKAIEAAARTFELRNALDELNSQRYYLAVFLQLGFTVRDARLRLGHWLTGATIPTAIDCLLDPSDTRYAPGFVRMWETLKNARAGNLPPGTVALQLTESPWVLREWIGELPGIVARPVDGAADTPASSEAGFDAILSEPELRWSPPEPPHFVCRLENLAAVGLVAPEYDLRACGRRLARISRAEDGSYDATDEELTLPAVAPGMAAELVERGSGEVAATLTLTCFDPNETVAVFELPSGRRLKPDDRLKPTRDYALIFAPDLALDPPGASWSAVASGRYRVATLAGRDVDAARLSSGGAIVWTPPTAASHGRPTPKWASVDARVEGAPEGLLPLGGSYRLAIRHGADVEVVYARCRMGPVPVSTETPGTTFAGPVTLPADATSGRVEWTFGLRRGGETARVKCSPHVRPAGAAILRGHVWTVLGPDSRLSVHGDRSAPIRVFPPGSWDGREVDREEWAVMEGETWVDRLGTRP